MNPIKTNKKGVDLLFKIKNRINRKNFLLLDADSILNLNLDDIIDYHIDNNNLITMILNEKNKEIKCTFVGNEYVDVYGVDNNNDRVLFNEKIKVKIENINDKNNIKIKKHILKHSKSFRILFGYEDIGFYLMNKSVYNILENESFTKEKQNKIDNGESIYKIKDNLLPFLMENAFSKKMNELLNINSHTQKLKSDLNSVVNIYPLRINIKSITILCNTQENFVYKFSDFASYYSVIEEIQKPYELIKPIFFQTENNTKNLFFNFKDKIEENLENGTAFNYGIPELEGISQESYIGERALIPKNTRISKTVVDTDLKINEKCKIISCILGANVSIGKECKITNCIIGDNAKIGDNCTLTECVIENSYEVKDGEKKSKGILSLEKEENMFILS